MTRRKRVKGNPRRVLVWDKAWSGVAREKVAKGGWDR